MSLERVNWMSTTAEQGPLLSRAPIVMQFPTKRLISDLVKLQVRSSDRKRKLSA